MIKPVNRHSLSSSQPRRGLQKISEVIPRLIQQYQLQAEITRERQEEAEAKQAAMMDAAMIRQAKAALFEDEAEVWEQEPIRLPAIAGEPPTDSSATGVQQFFGW